MYSNKDIELENRLKCLKDDATEVLKELNAFIQSDIRSDEQTDFSYDYLDLVRDALYSLIQTI